MARATQSLATGMKILGGGNVPAYTLEYIEASEKHPAGSYETIVIPYVELGRASNCAVRFGDSISTISRKHAAIERTPDGVWLVNLSKSNPTIIHSQGQTKQVKDRWYLNSGDIFQLSMEGPKIRFNTSSSGTAKMKFTNRMNLVVQQAIKPYRGIVISILAFFLAITSVLGYFVYDLNKDVASGQEELQKAANRVEKMKQMMVEDSLTRIEQREEDNAKIASLEEKLVQQRRAATAQQNKLRKEMKQLETQSGSTFKASSVDQSKIFYIEVTSFKVNYDGKEEDLDVAWSGTGFLLNDGRFVTARHVIQAWHFLSADASKGMVAANVLEQLGGKVVATFRAKSPDGTVLTFNSTQFKWDDSGDTDMEAVLNGSTYNCKVAQLPDPKDWAYYNSGKSSTMVANAGASTKLTQGTNVAVFGYSYRIGSSGTPTPLYSSSVVGFDGIRDGVIYLTNRNFGQGNSGGPAFVKNGSAYEVIGIVSAGTGAEIGILIPIGALK